MTSFSTGGMGAAMPLPCLAAAAAQAAGLRIVLALSAALAAGMLVLWRRGRRGWMPIRRHFARLGTVAPDEPCPCGRSSPPGRYADCCRGQDIERLRDDIRSWQWRQWSHRTYAGRRSSRPMSQRLKSLPRGEAPLPPWVERPEEFKFPVDRATLLAWSPGKPVDDGLPQEDASGLPF